MVGVSAVVGSTVLLLHMLGLIQASEGQKEIFALDGKGQPVAWWVVLKLPWQVRDAQGKYIPTPCDCDKPQCANVKVDVPEERKFGLCYLYADANNPRLRHFRDVGYDCLGQGGNDPVSHTLRQAKNATYWAIFNDQFNGIAEKQDKRRVCSGGDAFNAHAKGAVAFELDSGGYVLQSSTPNFPDPTIPTGDSDDDFIRLGCQHDNNVEYAQHLFAMSVDGEAIKAVGRGWQSARLCSTNHYHDMSQVLASAALRHNELEHPMAAALVDPDADDAPSTNVTVVTKVGSVRIRGLFKDKASAVPPWAMAAEAFGTDLSVASWWDENFGIPSLCDGDVYGAVAEAFCLKNNPLTLRPDGTFPYNVENLMQATTPWRLSCDDAAAVTWSLRGGRVRDGNHAKWAVGTPRGGSTSPTSQAALSIFADLNMEGYPCSKKCNGSQGGRGGSFYGIEDTVLHASLVGLVSDVCKCRPSTSHDDPFVTFRMCDHGCKNKIHEDFSKDDLPALSNASSSFWGTTDRRRPIVDDSAVANS
ncbi:hypothetical protein, variant 1 [Aphanomyces astaci]|uniref:Uncharacterized protein n=1 Tax=Aphanomyces astaci TaxID=112090 RepID=W4HCF3_APHAT|nr:hypothetical protein, variant 1 [Aphanomyces astaci]ETV89665.1 hypothetical protein, variant 1 [Aphanomyces astaci]|eukprot:XP_009822065.1 hypothetical protein, variant 1 [Aphanomyces astaci]